MDIVKLIITIICTCIITALISGVISSMDVDFGAFTVFILFGVLIGAGMLSYILVHKLFEGGETVKKTVQEKISENKEIKKIKISSDLELKKYNDAKSSFKYFSDDMLNNLYDDYKNDSGKSDMEILALEEELVTRGIITHSPMHEKIYLLKKKFQKH